MNNKIANPKVKVQSGIELNDKDYMTKLLTCIKDMEKNYVIAMTEASNEILYNHIYTIFNNLSNLQREIYEMMFRYGWYQLEKAEKQEINTKHQMLTQEWQDIVE